MAGTYRKKTPKVSGKTFTKADVKLLLCVIIFAISVALKYADSDTAAQLRHQAASLLHGGTDAGEVLAVVGEAVGDNGILEVFSGGKPLQEVFAPSIDQTVPQQGQTTKEEQIADDIVPAEAGEMEPVEEDVLPAYAEGGYSEDLEDREQTLFPKQADLTAYVMSFAHQKPVEARLSSTFGSRTHPISGKVSYHFGLDLAAPKGTPILAFADGAVRETGNGSYGNYLIVDHEDGFSTLYAHCDKLIAQKGENIKVGQEIAQVGATGNATGNHLHFEIWRDGKALNPDNYIQYS